ncbi:hypothetical protein OROGR_031127 [Orobanche gracilis]
MAAALPQEIIDDILRRLSVRDLLRCRSVSKQWCSLIDGPEFVKMQLDYALKTPSRLGAVIIVLDGSRDLHWINLYRHYASKHLSINEPYYDISASCNGLLLLHYYDKGMIIWNPSTRWLRKLPTPIKHEFRKNVFYGFGYDHLGDDYKFAKTNSWKIICFPYVLLDSNHVCVVSTRNALHWVVWQNPKSWNEMFIVAFDLGKEECLEVPLPSFENQPTDIYFLDLGGSLCAVCNFIIPLSDYDSDSDWDSDYDSKSERVDVWMMKEYGVKESWTKLFSIVRTEQTGKFNNMKPVSYLRALANDRILLVQDDDRFITYDLAGERVQEDADFCQPLRIMNSFACVESLVGLD